MSITVSGGISASSPVLAKFAVAVLWDGTGGQPLRPASGATQPCLWFCPTQPTGGGTTAGGAGSVDGLDIWVRTP